MSEWLSDTDKPLEFSFELSGVNWANYQDYGYYDDLTGEFISTTSQIEGWLSIVLDPMEYLPGPGVKVKVRPGNKNWTIFLKSTKGTYKLENYPNMTKQQLIDKRSSDYQDWQEMDIEIDIPTPNTTSEDD